MVSRFSCPWQMEAVAPFPDTVDGQHGRLREGRRIERAGRVRKVMLGEQELSPLAIEALDRIELVQDQALEHHLFLDPDWHRGEEGRQSPWGEGIVGLEQTLELEEGLVVEDHRVQL